MPHQHMPHKDDGHELRYGNAHVQICSSRSEAGTVAAARAAEVITSAIRRQNSARVIAATGNSQIPLVEALVQLDVDWKRVELFHMDEYVGMAVDHPSSFRRWIRTRLEDKVHPGKTNYLAGDAPDLNAEILRYSKLLMEAPIDLAFVGFGENGHIAFNDPHTADFNDSVVLKLITLDDISRGQQSREGHFKSIESVPREALTVSCSGLFSANTWVCCVPEGRKAEAVRNALEGPIAESCPASLVRRHRNAHVYLDLDSASQLAAARNVAAVEH